MVSARTWLRSEALRLGGAVEASDEIYHGALAGAGGAHHCDPLARGDGDGDVVQRLNQVAGAVVFFRAGGVTLGDVVESNHRGPISSPTLDTAPKGAFFFSFIYRYR
jgi:hypothetical protein